MDYCPGPTGANFLASRAFLKLVMGPVGGGKSTVCLADLFARACFQDEPGAIRIRVHQENNFFLHIRIPLVREKI